MRAKRAHFLVCFMLFIETHIYISWDSIVGGRCTIFTLKANIYGDICYLHEKYIERKDFCFKLG